VGGELLPALELLEKYADVAMGVGLGVERGDRVVVSSPVQLPEFTRILVATAYGMGAESVDVLWQDDEVRRHVLITARKRLQVLSVATVSSRWRGLKQERRI
jgi:leucyl aminopeptidase (aminopeptidase T)